MSVQFRAKVLSNMQAAEGLWLMRLEAPECARTALPGQFIMLRVAPALDPLLKRAFAVHSAEPDKGVIDILYAVVGKGTELLSRVRSGELLEAIGPLGRGFRIDHDRDPILVGGGVGVAPLLLLAEHMKKSKAQVRLFYGCRSASGLAQVDAFLRLGVSVTITTEDGSRGHEGMVTDLLLPELMAAGIGPPPASVYACGPKQLLASVARLCRGVGVPCQVSLHPFMGCGIGACLGCAVPRAQTEGRGLSYAKACVDGPVFDAEEVNLED
ncbi:MAG: dihydroorotate dehydrogenase electron transfer subunit [Pseudomonadota bacterium]